MKDLNPDPPIIAVEEILEICTLSLADHSEPPIESVTLETVTPEPVVESEPERNELIGSHRKRAPEEWRHWAPEVLEAFLEQDFRLHWAREVCAKEDRDLPSTLKPKLSDSGVNPDCDCCGS